MAFPTDWGRKCKLTIQNAKVPGTLTDFPVLLDLSNLPSEMFDADGSYPALNGGGDIRFSSDAAGTTQLACEIVSFVTNNDPALGSAEIWVKIPSLASATDTDFYVWYNKAGETQPAVTDTYGRNNVWDSNFKLVQHMSQDPSGTAPQMIDSTSNSNDGTSAGTMTSGDLVAGKVGKGLDFDGTNDYINHGDSASLDITGALTLSAWVKMVNNPVTGSEGVISKFRHETGNLDQRAYCAYITTSGLFKSQISNDGTYNDGVSSNAVGGTTDVADGTYRFLSVVFVPSTSLKVYVDGVEDGSSTTSIIASLYNSPAPFWTGLWYDSPDANRYAQAIIDEVRVSSVARSANWLLTEYNNQSSPGTFVVEGTPETPGGGILKINNETAGAVDSFYKALIINKVIAEVVSVSETVVKTLNLLKIKAEGAAAYDEQIKKLNIIKVLVDVAGALDTFFDVLGIVKAHNESVSASDMSLYTLSIVKIYSEVADAIDVLVKAINITKIKSETGSASDEINKAIALVKLLSETAGAIDAVNKIFGFIKVRSESVSANDVLIKLLSIVKEQPESAGATETADKKIDITKVLQESVGVIDAFK